MPADGLPTAEVNRESSIANRRSPKDPRRLFGAVALVSLLVYLPSVFYDFVWDDNRLVKNNSYLDQTNPREIFTRGFAYNPELGRNTALIPYYRPLTVLSFFMERKEWNLSPTGYHLTNVILHGLAVFLVCLLLFRLFGSAPGAAVAGLFFGVNPATNSAVVWISGRNYLLAMVLLLFAAWLALQDLKAKPFYTSLLGTSLLLALLAHEAALVFVPVLLFWIVLNRDAFRPVVSWFIAVLLVLGGYLLLRLAVARIPFPAGVLADAVHQPLLLLNVYGEQVLRLFVPFGQHVIDRAGPLSRPSVFTALGMVFLLLPVGIALGRRSAPAALGAAWLVLFLLPSGSAMLLGPAGRTLYLAVPGVLMLALAVGDRPRATGHRLRAWLLTLWAGYAAACGVYTVRRNPVWHDEFTLFRTIAEETPDAPGARLNLGNALQARGQTESAIEQYRAAIRLQPDYADPRNKLAFLLLGQNDLAGAIEQFRAVVRREPNSAEARNNLALTLKNDGQLDSAIVEYRASLSIEPESETTLTNLGNAYLAQADYRPAISLFEAALRLSPGFEPARVSLVKAQERAGLPDSARPPGK